MEMRGGSGTPRGGAALGAQGGRVESPLEEFALEAATTTTGREVPLELPVGDAGWW